jgi:tetratricopeptide (TPR) repeat protein
VTVQLNDLLYRIQQNLRQPVEVDESLSMNIFIDDQSTTGLNGQYVHFLLLINMLLRMKPSENDKRELLALCKEEYRGHEGHESLIAEFEQYYSAGQALEWYTRESFLYKTLNKALRKQDIHMLYLFRWFIVDIHRKLVQYQCQCPIHVYRGQLMSNSEVERLKMSIGKLISFNSFLSASLIESQAVAFQKNGSTMNGLQRVLFEINADPQVVISKPFADVSSHSDISSEYEVLFMLGCVFRIKDVCKRGTNQGWVIHMTLCNDSDHHLSQLVEHMKIESEDYQPNLTSLGLLLWKMGKYELAEKYLRRSLAEISSDDPSLGPAYLNLGLVIAEKGEYAESLRWYEKALMIYMQIQASDYITIGLLHNNIGTAHRGRGDYTQAMESFVKAVSLFEQAQDENHPNMAMFYNNIGLIHYSQHNYAEALCVYEKSRAIYLNHRHPHHRDIGLVYNNIGVAHLDLGNLDLALEYFERTITIYLESLPPIHPDLALTYRNMSLVYEKKNELSRAWQYAQKALEIRQNALSSEHRDVIESKQTLQRISARLPRDLFPLNK